MTHAANFVIFTILVKSDDSAIFQKRATPISELRAKSGRTTIQILNWTEFVPGHHYYDALSLPIGLFPPGRICRR